MYADHREAEKKLLSFMILARKAKYADAVSSALEISSDDIPAHLFFGLHCSEKRVHIALLISYQLTAEVYHPCASKSANATNWNGCLLDTHICPNTASYLHLLDFAMTASDIQYVVPGKSL